MTQLLSYTQIINLVRKLYYIEDFFDYGHTRAARAARAVRFFRRRLS